MEEWRDIQGYEGHYQVSSCGRVRSVKSGGLVMKSWLPKNGYPTVTLWLRNKKKNHLIHRLVAMAFIPNPEGLSDVNHIDENKMHNSVENLEWVTHLDNLRAGTVRERMSKSHTGKQGWAKGMKRPDITERQTGKPHPHKGTPRKGIKRKKVQL